MTQIKFTSNTNFLSLPDYRSGCFASTQCKVFKPNETWPLTPFCGRSRCVALKVSKYQQSGFIFGEKCYIYLEISITFL